MTVEPLRKFVPVTVSVKAAPPAMAEFGLIEVIVAGLAVTWEAEDAAPPGFCTVMLRVAAEAREAVGMVAVIDVVVPAVTVKAVLPT
jgi:hypothetical protein